MQGHVNQALVKAYNQCVCMTAFLPKNIQE